MVVNGAKTSLMIVSAAASYRPSAQIVDLNGNMVKSSNSVKYLGVTLDFGCGFATHVDQIKRRIRSRSWTLNKLRKSGFNDEELVKIYCTYIRPVAEYASVAWGP